MSSSAQGGGGGDESQGDTATVPDDAASLGQERRHRRARTAVLMVLAGLVAVGLTGGLGVRSETVSGVAAGGLRVDLTHAAVARGGLAVPFRLVVHRPGGFEGPVEVRISRSYLDTFDENGRSPEPESSTATASEVVWAFDPPPGETLVVSLDVRIEPAVWGRRDGTTTVRSGPAVVRLHHPTWVLP